MIDAGHPAVIYRWRKNMTPGSQPDVTSARISRFRNNEGAIEGGAAVLDSILSLSWVGAASWMIFEL